MKWDPLNPSSVPQVQAVLPQDDGTPFLYLICEMRTPYFILNPILPSPFKNFSMCMQVYMYVHACRGIVYVICF